MPNDPQDRSADGSIRQVGPWDGQDRIIPEEVTEPVQKRNDADTEWLSMATADPAHFLKDLHFE
ncbi:MAG: hypothetical protein M3514_14705 [Actinomycetota bacterium]|nr:hypothetical protein [Rubrobacteraceae bacterium]MDQ3498724.1 hypothetical protein [Actinomycetota bacterium]